MSLQFVDLHTHTTASDGSDSPSEVVRKAAGASLAALAVTDHDTINGLLEAEEEASHHNLNFIRGCEISTREVFGEVHLLGLWLPKESRALTSLESFLVVIREARARRNVLMLEKMREAGLDVSMQDLEEIASGEVIGRPHFAALLMRMGVVNNRNQAFQQYLRSGGKFYVPRELVSPEEGVEALRACTGCVSLAHPCLGRQKAHEIDSLVARLVPLGLTGIEAYHSEHSEQDERLCVELAAKYNLLLTGGSDYHGLSKPTVRLGCGKGRLRVTTAVTDKWEARLKMA